MKSKQLIRLIKLFFGILFNQKVAPKPKMFRYHGESNVKISVQNSPNKAIFKVHERMTANSEIAGGKYPLLNWKEVSESQFMDKIYRHFNEYFVNNQKIDTDCPIKSSHLIALACNALMLAEKEIEKESPN